MLEDPGSVATLWGAAEVDLALRSSGLQPSHWLDPDAAPESWGRASGSLSVRGPTDAPVLLGSLVVEEFPAGLLVVPRLTTGLRADSEGLHLVEGTLEPEGPWISFEGRLPVRLTLTEAPASVARTQLTELYLRPDWE